MDWKDYDFAGLGESLKYEYKLLQYAMGFFKNDNDNSLTTFENDKILTEETVTEHLGSDDHLVQLILQELQPLALCMAYKILDSFIVEVLSKEGIDFSKRKNSNYTRKCKLLRETKITGPTKLKDIVRLTRVVYSYYREDRGKIMHQMGFDTTKYKTRKLRWFFFYARELLEFTEAEDNMHDVYAESLLISAKQFLKHGKLIKTNSRLFEIRKAKVIDNNIDCIINITCAKNYFEKESDYLKKNIFFDLTIENNGNEYFFPAHKVRTMPGNINLNTYSDFFVRCSEE